MLTVEMICKNVSAQYMDLGEKGCGWSGEGERGGVINRDWGVIGRGDIGLQLMESDGTGRWCMGPREMGRVTKLAIPLNIALVIGI